MTRRKCAICYYLIVLVWEFGMLGAVYLAWSQGWNGSGMTLFVIAVMGMLSTSAKHACGKQE